MVTFLLPTGEVGGGNDASSLLWRPACDSLGPGLSTGLPYPELPRDGSLPQSARSSSPRCSESLLGNDGIPIASTNLLLPLLRRALGKGNESFLRRGADVEGGVGAGAAGGRDHQTSRSPAVSRVEQSDNQIGVDQRQSDKSRSRIRKYFASPADIARSVTHEEWIERGEERGAPEAQSQI